MNWQKFDSYKEDNRREVKKQKADFLMLWIPILLLQLLWRSHHSGVKETKSAIGMHRGTENAAKLKKDFWIPLTIEKR